MLAELAVSTNNFPASGGDWARFQPPSAPPKLQKPNRRARRAAIATARKRKD